MSLQGIQKFSRLIESNRDVQHRIGKGINDGRSQDMQAFADLGKEFGCDFTADEARDFLAGLVESGEAGGDELSDADLEKVAGGGVVRSIARGVNQTASIGVKFRKPDHAVTEQSVQQTRRVISSGGW